MTQQIYYALAILATIIAIWYWYTHYHNVNKISKTGDLMIRCADCTILSGSFTDTAGKIRDLPEIANMQLKNTTITFNAKSYGDPVGKITIWYRDNSA
jgi:hypothetical protein